MTDIALTLTGVTKAYDGRTVLHSVALSVKPGRVHALVGENGAGKSTLIRVACGLVVPETGTVTAGEVRLALGDARGAIRGGIGVVHQHFMLVPTLTVAESVALGAEPTTGPLGLWVDRERVAREVRALSLAHALPVDPDARVEDLTVGERQRVEILKVLYRGARVLLLDEPTAVLSPLEVKALLETVRALASRGAAVLFVSHKLDEVFSVADEITVLRRGRVVLSRATAETTVTEVARSVVGGEPPGEGTAVGDSAVPVGARAAAATATGDEPGLTLTDIRAPGLEGVTLTVKRGEILGVAGVEGNGQRALAEAVAGLLPLTAGEVRVGGRTLAGLGVAARRAAGVGYVPEDREGRGLLPGLSIAENVALGAPEVASRGGRFDRGAAETAARAVIARFSVRPDDPWAPVGTLSGGNQQKVLLGRELSRTLTTLVVAQPTRGVDLGASAEIHGALRMARSQGVAVLLVSSELDELRGLSDRIVVMRRGAVAGELTPAEATDARLGELMVGG